MNLTGTLDIWQRLRSSSFSSILSLIFSLVQDLSPAIIYFKQLIKFTTVPNERDSDDEPKKNLIDKS